MAFQQPHLNQDPSAPPLYQSQMEYGTQPQHYTPLPPNATFGSAVVASRTNGPAFADSDDYNMTTSCLMSLLCFFCGGWLSLPLSFMAIRISSSAKEAARRGDAALAQRKAMYSLLLNVIAVILYVYVAMTVLSFMFWGYRRV
eukprot:Em0002g1293a